MYSELIGNYKKYRIKSLYDNILTISSPSNMMRQFTNNLKETGMILGQLFVPLLQKVLPVINGATIAIKRLLVNIAGFLNIDLDLESFGQGYNDMGENVDGATDSMDDFTDSVKKAKSALRGFDELKVINTTDTKTVEGLENNIDLTEEIISATEEYEKVWDKAFEQMSNRAEQFANIIGNYLYPISDLFEHLFSGDFDLAAQDVSNIVSGIFDFIGNAIEDVDWEAIGNSMGDFLANIDWKKVLSSVGKAFWNGINAAIELWKSLFDAAPVETTIITAVGVLQFLGLTDALSGVFKKNFPTSISFKDKVIGLALAGATFSLAESDEEIKELVAAPITAALATYTFTKDIKISLVVSGITLAYEGIESLGNWIGKEAATAVAENAGLDASQIAEQEDMTLIEAIKWRFTDDFEEAWDKAMPVIMDYIADSFGPGFLGPVAEVYLSEYGSTLVRSIQDGFFEAWNAFGEWFKTTAVPSWMKDIVSPLFSEEKWTWNGIKEGLLKSFDNAIKAVKAAWNAFAISLNKMLNFEVMGQTVNLGKLPTFNMSVEKYEANTSAAYIPTYSGVGAWNKVNQTNMSTAPIEEALYSATKRAMTEYLNSNNNTSNVNVVLEGDASEFFRVVQNSANDYYNRTGRPAFNN